MILANAVQRKVHVSERTRATRVKAYKPKNNAIIAVILLKYNKT